jgi:hypothetical protein
MPGGQVRASPTPTTPLGVRIPESQGPVRCSASCTASGLSGPRSPRTREVLVRAVTGDGRRCPNGPNKQPLRNQGHRRGPAFRAHGHPPLRPAGSLHFDGPSSGSVSVLRGTHRVFVPVASRSRVLGRDDAGEPAVRIPPATDTLGCGEPLVRHVEECQGVFPTEGS